MRSCASLGVVLPKDFSFTPDRSLAKASELPITVQLPHRASSIDAIGRAFSNLSAFRPDHVFVFAPLHAGRIVGCSDAVYCWSDGVRVDGTVADDDVCSEEFSADMLLPFIEGTFGNVPVQAFFATGRTPLTENLVSRIASDFPNSVLIVSNNIDVDCASMWLGGQVEIQDDYS